MTTTALNKTKSKQFGPPDTSADFDRAYKTPFHWIWTDARIPRELKDLLENNKPESSLELGCGTGRFSAYAAAQRIHATAVDFSPVAIEKAKSRLAGKRQQPHFVVGDVTDLKNIHSQFDVSFDIGCFHCLDGAGEMKYVNELARLLKSGGTHLIWALDTSPSDIKLSAEYIAGVFSEKFELVKAAARRRRLAASHWYWLVRK